MTTLDGDTSTRANPTDERDMFTKSLTIQVNQTAAMSVPFFPGFAWPVRISNSGADVPISLGPPPRPCGAS
jgi:hypothetical protein